MLNNIEQMWAFIKNKQQNHKFLKYFGIYAILYKWLNEPNHFHLSSICSPPRLWKHTKYVFSTSTTIANLCLCSFSLITYSHIFQNFTLHEGFSFHTVPSKIYEHVILYVNCNFPYKITCSWRRCNFIWKLTIFIQNDIFIFTQIFETLILYEKSIIPYKISSS